MATNPRGDRLQTTDNEQKAVLFLQVLPLTYPYRLEPINIVPELDFSKITLIPNWLTKKKVYPKLTTQLINN